MEPVEVVPFFFFLRGLRFFFFLEAESPVPLAVGSSLESSSESSGSPPPSSAGDLGVVPLVWVWEVPLLWTSSR